MDPQHWLFLTVAEEALQDANYIIPATGPNNVGVYVGAADGTWHSGKFYFPYLTNLIEIS